MSLENNIVDTRLFYRVIAQGNLQELQKLLDQIKDKKEHKNYVNFCFAITLYNGFLLSQYLIDLGADVNYKDACYEHD